MATTPTLIPVTRETLESHGDPPAPTSSLYMHRSKYTRTDAVEQHVIAGVHLVFKAGDSNNLYDAFNVARTQTLDPTALPAARALLIVCDTLEISGELSLPEYEVAIYARRLIFKDQASINTSPLNWTLDKAADYDPNARKGGANGAEGRHAGKQSIFINELQETDHASIKRFICRGGRGQHAGLGKNGAPGSYYSSISNKFELTDSGHYNVYNASFANPCVYAYVKWYWAGIVIHQEPRGTEKWPTNGEDALAPGRPGSGGNGGAWISNKQDLVARLDNAAANAGTKAPNVRGGAAGSPATSTQYDLTIRFTLIGSDPSGDNNLRETRTTKAGINYDAEDSKKGNGKTEAPKTINVANAWVHPLQLESVLRYARDAFLAGARDEVTNLLIPYESALSAPLPENKEAGLPWVMDNDGAQWNAAQAEVASMLHRLRTQLDYFGNPAGYMPFLSLQASMRLYDLETKDAIKTLLLAKWVQEEADKNQSAANAFGSAIEQTNKDTDKIAEQLVQSEAKMADIETQMTTLEGRLTTLSTNLNTLRNELFAEAANNLEIKGRIKFAVKMAAAITQVIPVGQPVLGTIGKLANIAADIQEEGTPDTVSKIGDTIKKARDAANKAKQAKEKAKKKSKKPENSKEAKEEASGWAKVGNGLGPALSMAGGAIGALQISEDEIEVELAKMTAASPKWKDIVNQIRTLNRDKASLFKELSKVLQAIGDGYARLASNADSLITLYEERNQTLGKLSAEANQVIAKLGQSARLSLQQALYLLVKSYETTVFTTIDVDWGLDKVFDKISELLKPQKGFDAASINAFADTIAPLFEANKKTLKLSLLKDYGFAAMNRSALEFGFTVEETPEPLDELRRGQVLTVNPLTYGLVLPVRERAKATGFECKKLVFNEKSGPPLPKTGNAIVSLRVSNDGTVRRDEHLYAVRSDAPRIWTWTFHFSDRKLQPTIPSLSSLDLLNMLLDTSDDEVKEKLAAPPAWSDLLIDLEFSPSLPVERRPALESLLFVCNVDSIRASTVQRVLDVRAAATDECFVITPVDLAGRGNGYGDTYRIYNKATKLNVKAPEVLGERPFSHWHIQSGDASRKEEKSAIDIVLDTDTLAYCRYKPKIAVTSVIRDRFAGKNVALIEQEIGNREQATRVAAMCAEAASNTSNQGSSDAGPLPIRAGAGPSEPVIGVVEEGEQPTVLEAEADWAKVAYKGVVGYIAR